MCWFSLQQWASLYQPLIFSNEVSQTDSAPEVFLNKLDPTKAFRGKAKVPPPKNKQTAQSNSGGAAKGQGSAGRHGGSKRWNRSNLERDVCCYAAFILSVSPPHLQKTDLLSSACLDAGFCNPRARGACVVCNQDLSGLSCVQFGIYKLLTCWMSTGLKLYQKINPSELTLGQSLVSRYTKILQKLSHHVLCCLFFQAVAKKNWDKYTAHHQLILDT